MYLNGGCNNSKFKGQFLLMWFFCVAFFPPMMLQGEEGVREVLQILNDEFRLSMALSGKTRDAKRLLSKQYVTTGT